MDQGPSDPRARAAGHSWGPLGTPFCLRFLLMISAKFSPPVEGYSDSSWGMDLRASTGSVWLSQSALLVTFLRPQKQALSLPALRQKCTWVMVKGFSEFSLASFRPRVNGCRKPGKQGTDCQSRVVRRAQGTPGSEAAHHGSNRREPTAHCICTGSEVMTTVPGLGWTSQLEACPSVRAEAGQSVARLLCTEPTFCRAGGCIWGQPPGDHPGCFWVTTVLKKRADEET